MGNRNTERRKIERKNAQRRLQGKTPRSTKPPADAPKPPRKGKK